MPAKRYTTALIDDEEDEENDDDKPVTLVNYVMRDPILFGDFRNAVDESEPRYYEDLLDYDAISALFEEVYYLN